MFQIKLVSVLLSTIILPATLVFTACQSSTQSLTLAGVTAANNENAPETRPTPVNEEPLKIAAVGDIMLASTFPNETRMPPADGADLLKDVTPILQSADIAFGNLEGPMLEGGVSEKCPHLFPPAEMKTAQQNPPLPQPTPATTPTPPAKNSKPVRCFAFRVPTRYGKHLKAAGFDVLSVANNHANDFGDEGRASTRRVLDELGIKHAGSDRNQFAATVLEARGKKVAFIGFAHNNVSLNVNDLEAARRAVQEQSRKADIVVVSFHGGAEGASQTRVPNQTEIFFGEKRGNLPLFARTVIDAGADLVLGHGPHVLRGMEIYKNRLVAYSLGNFATYGWFQLAGATAETLVLEVELAADGKFVSGKINSVKLEGRGIPVLDKTKSAVSTIKNLSQMDFGANAPVIKDDGTFTAK
jgi:hypothetical protein